MAGTLGTNQVFPSIVDTTSWNVSTKFDTLASIRGRLGVAVGPVLVYGTGGGAWANTQSDIALMDITTPVSLWCRQFRAFLPHRLFRNSPATRR
jgi:opacity protein-like surface antigen